MGLMEVGAKCQLPAEDENLPSLHRHTPDLHLHPCNDIQMCSDVICPGQREKSEQKTIAPFGEKLMILVNPVAWGTHTRERSHWPSALAGDGDMALPGGRLTGLLSTSGWKSPGHTVSCFPSSEVLCGPPQLERVSLPSTLVLKVVTLPPP